MAEKKMGVIRRSLQFIGKLIGWLRVIVVNGLFLVMIAVLFLAFSEKKMPSIPDDGALILEIKGTLVEQLSYTDPLKRLIGEDDPANHETLLQDVIDAIMWAKDDSRINSLVIKTDYLMHAGISKLQEVNMALQAFRASGKKIIAVADNYNQDQYLLASQAEQVFLNPMGAVSLQGYGLYRSYFKEALDKLSINFHVFKVGNYKSALEPFIRNDMSDAAKEANLLWLNQLWAQYSATVAQRRGLSEQAIDEYANGIDQLLEHHKGDSAVAALEAGLVDGLKSRDEINSYLIAQVGKNEEGDSFSGVDFEQYVWLKKHEKIVKPNKPNVGVLVAAGNITNGKQPPGSIGSESLSALIRQARTDDEIKAVVLRIDSGGGSAFASELIRRELQLLKDSGKPLVVSMGSMAASGGYWIASLADEIWATPSTLTGSIGIFGAFPTFEKSFAQLGIYSDGVGTTKVADAFNITRPMNPVAARAIQQTIEHGYRQFLDIVASGRSMPSQQVADIAQGRVWSGIEAKRLNLVDQLGGLQDAVAAAAQLAALDDYESRVIETPLSPREEFFRQLGAVFTPFQTVLLPQPIMQLIAPLQSSLAFTRLMNDPAGAYVHCLVCVAL